MTTSKSGNLDTAFFAVLVGHKGNIANSLDERDQPDSISEIVRDIRGGEYHRVIAVLAFNPVEGWSRDITTEVAQKILDTNEGPYDWSACAHDLVETALRVFPRRAA